MQQSIAIEQEINDVDKEVKSIALNGRENDSESKR